jgi:uncharacterized protein (TIGR00730 family)
MLPFARVCVFCGSSAGRSGAYSEAARATGAWLAAQGIELVYGGGRNGLMGILADAALAGGGRVTGIIPDFLLAKEVGHTGIQELRVTQSMHERKAAMVTLADAFLALPGGCGTFEELLEVVTWAQLRLHAKPIGIFNTGGFYDPLLQMLDHARAEGFLRPEHRALVLHGTDHVELLTRMAAQAPMTIDKV